MLLSNRHFSSPCGKRSGGAAGEPFTWASADSKRHPLGSKTWCTESCSFPNPRCHLTWNKDNQVREARGGRGRVLKAANCRRNSESLGGKRKVQKSFQGNGQHRLSPLFASSLKRKEGEEFRAAGHSHPRARREGWRKVVPGGGRVGRPWLWRTGWAGTGRDWGHSGADRGLRKDRAAL